MQSVTDAGTALSGAAFGAFFYNTKDAAGESSTLYTHSGSLGRVVTLGKIGPMAFFFVHEKCQHYYESGHTSGA